MTARNLKNAPALLYLLLIEGASLGEVAAWLKQDRPDCARQVEQAIQVCFGAWPNVTHDRQRLYVDRMVGYLTAAEGCPESVAVALRAAARQCSRSSPGLTRAPSRPVLDGLGPLTKASQVALGWLASSIRRGPVGYLYVVACPCCGDLKIGSCQALRGRWRRLTDTPHGLHVLRVVEVGRGRHGSLERWALARLIELGAEPSRLRWFNAGTEWIKCDLALADQVLGELGKPDATRPRGLRHAFSNQMEICADEDSQKAVFAVLNLRSKGAA